MRAEPPTIRLPFKPCVLTPEDLAAVLGVGAVDLQALAAVAPKLYSLVLLPKRNGENREIRPPSRKLRALQRTILHALDARVRYPRWMMGSVPGRSIFDHAGLHVGSHMVATFDVRKFFPSTTETMVERALRSFGIGGAALDLVVQLVTSEGQLPQGAPTSPLFANLALESADRRIDSFCRRKGLRFSRYVDDIAISGDCDLRPIKGTIIKFIDDCGFAMAEDKIAFMPRSESQIVTKLIVNDKLRPNSEFINDVSSTIRDCLAVGPAIVAHGQGLTVRQLKARLTGRVSHISRASPKRGKRLRGRLCGIRWSQLAMRADRT